MRVFVTGATGFVGSAIVPEVLAHGHQVVGLARSDKAAASLEAVGAEVHRGDLEDLDSLRSGASSAEGVIHAGFIHDFARFKEVCEVDRLAIEALGGALEGTNRPLIVTSGTALVSPGRLATEDSEAMIDPNVIPRAASEAVAMKLAEHGVRSMVVRLSPSVHGDGDHGFVPMLINLAKEKGVSAFIGEGANRWTAVHRLDAARLYRLALETGHVGAKYHGVDEDGIPFKDIAASIGAGLGIPTVSLTPEDAAAHFGWFAAFAGIDSPASSKLTQEQLGWRPSEVGLIKDLQHGTYFG